MSYEFYKVIHLTSIFAIFLSLGAALMHVIGGGTKATISRKLFFITHGTSITLAIIAGFGLLARLSVSFPWPAWVWVKLVVWICLADAPRVIFKKPKLAGKLWLVLIALGFLAASMATTKFSV